MFKFCAVVIRREILYFVLIFAPNFYLFAQNDNLSYTLAANSQAPSDPTWSFPQGSMNLQNGTFHIHIPLSTIPQRTGPPVTISLDYDSLSYNLVDYTAPAPSSIMDRRWQPTANFLSLTTDHQGAVVGTGWNLRVSTRGDLHADGIQGHCTSFDPVTGFGQDIPTFTQSNWQYIDPEGGVHIFGNGPDGVDVNTIEIPSSWGSGLCNANHSLEVPAFDGSGYWLSVHNDNLATVYDLHGNTVYSNNTIQHGNIFNLVNQKDTNGNFTQDILGNQSSTQDQLGRSLSLPTGVMLSQGSVTVGTTFNGPTPFPQGGPRDADWVGSVSTLQSIQLPDGREYRFEYDNGGVGHNGVMAKMILPTGGVVLFHTPMGFAGETPRLYQPTDAISIDGNTWAFTQNPTRTAMTITAPFDSQSQHTQLRRVSYTYTQFSGNAEVYNSNIVDEIFADSISSSPLSQSFYTKDECSRITAFQQYTDGTLTKNKSFQYLDLTAPITLSNQTSVGAYHTSLLTAAIESVSNGSLLRRTDTAYAHPGDKIYDTPSSVSVSDASGLVSQTLYSYDEFPLSATSGYQNNDVQNAANHDPSYGTQVTSRGLLTGISQWISGNQYLRTSTRHHNILGQLVSDTDDRGYTTSYDYSDQWYAGTHCTTKPAFAYLTRSKNALGNETVQSLDDCTGVRKTLLDPNGNTTRFDWDSSTRLTDTSLPDGGHVHIDFGGSNVPEVITTTVSSAPDPDQKSTQTLDDLGRPRIATAGSNSTVVTTYDVLGRIHI